MVKATQRKSLKTSRSRDAHSADTKHAKKSQKKQATSTGQSVSKWIALVGVLILTVVTFLLLNEPFAEVPEKTHTEKSSTKTKNVNNIHEKHGKKRKEQSRQAKDTDEFGEFKTQFLNKLFIKTEGFPIEVQELKHNNQLSSVKAYLVDGLLTSYECDQLLMTHDRHTEGGTMLDPILCFSDITTLRKHLKHAKLNIQVSTRDFTKGTKCLNESFSSHLGPHLTWSYSTAFYPGESKFSSYYAERIKKVTGMPLENGGKFQITSYPQGVAYKNHTDCIVNSNEKRDRFATILVYLKDVEHGGETQFPELGIKVKPKKGRALVWNSMDSNGHCDPLSLHNSSQVESGHKYIIQRWYYYQNFPSLGKRIPEPELPMRKPHQPRVTCDEYEFGSCRWYDEWNYDHLIDYPYS